MIILTIGDMISFDRIALGIEIQVCLSADPLGALRPSLNGVVCRLCGENHIDNSLLRRE
jgi:hypothetical protein